MFGTSIVKIQGKNFNNNKGVNSLILYLCNVYVIVLPFYERYKCVHKNKSFK